MRTKKESSTKRYAFPLFVCVPLFFLGVYFLDDYKNAGYPAAMLMMFIYTWFVWIVMINNSNNGDISSALYSRPNEESGSSQKHYRKVSEVSNDSISTYPRITVYQISARSSLSEENMIFDSSDFEVISHAFGSAKGAQRTLKQGDEIVINEKRYKTTDLHVDFMNLFDDYSAIYSPWFGRHTDVYTGIDMPYNMQIIMSVRDINEEKLI